MHRYVLEIKLLESELLAKKFSQKQIDLFFTFSESKEYLNFIIIPINLLTKILIISLLIFFGSSLFDVKLKFKEFLYFTVKAEFIFLLSILCEILYFKFILKKFSYSDVQNFSSLSVLNLIDYRNLDPWFIYPLQLINIFEMAYIIYLSYKIGQLSKTNTANGLKIVACSYVPALLLWVTVVMFFTLNLS
jgi:hypothetical protein